MENNLPILIQEFPVPASAIALIEQASALSGFVANVTNQEEMNQASEKLNEITKLSNAIEAERKIITAPIDDAKKRVKMFFGGYRNIAENAKSAIKKTVLAYTQEQDRIAREAARLAEIEAEKHRKKLEKQAEKAEAKGNGEKAEILRDTASAIVPDIHVAEKTSGIAKVVNYSADVVSLKILLQAVIDGKVPMDAIQPNMTFINKNARALQSNFDWPGCKLNKNETIKGTGR